MYIYINIYAYMHTHIVYTYHIGRTVLDTGLSCFSVHHRVDGPTRCVVSGHSDGVLQCVAVCCRGFQCVAVCRSVFQCVHVHIWAF